MPGDCPASLHLLLFVCGKHSAPSRTPFRQGTKTVRLPTGIGVHLQTGMLFGITTESCSASERNRVHLRPDSPNGLVISNNHVVEGCTAAQILGVTSTGRRLGFRKLATDGDVDLVALRPQETLADGLELGDDTDPELGTVVPTWGYPLTLNGPAPLLSRGIVAGFTQDIVHGKSVKHIVVNGAFNPGNSGRPLIKSNDERVIGIVVAKYHLYPPSVKAEFEALAGTGVLGAITYKDETGKQVTKWVGPMLRFAAACCSRVQIACWPRTLVSDCWKQSVSRRQRLSHGPSTPLQHRSTNVEVSALWIHSQAC